MPAKQDATSSKQGINANIGPLSQSGDTEVSKDIRSSTEQGNRTSFKFGSAIGGDILSYSSGPREILSPKTNP